MRYMMIIAMIIVGIVRIESQVVSRGLNLVIKEGEFEEKIKLYEKSYALVIGNSEYEEWSVLPGVKKDVEEVSKVLEEHGFEVRVLKDQKAEEMREGIRKFINEKGLEYEARILIYYTGHGHTMKNLWGGEMGYIVPVDAARPDINEKEFLKKTMSMQSIETYAKEIQAKHALFLFDSCFSGAIFALTKESPKHITNKTKEPVRQFITAGSAEEAVPDKSIFREEFVKALRGEGDINQDGYITAVELGEHLQKNVILYSKDSQHPQHGKIRDSRLDKGDFVFEKPRKTNFLMKAEIINEKKEKKEEYEGNENVYLRVAWKIKELEGRETVRIEYSGKEIGEKRYDYTASIGTYSVPILIEEAKKEGRYEIEVKVKIGQSEKSAKVSFSRKSYIPEPAPIPVDFRARLEELEKRERERIAKEEERKRIESAWKEYQERMEGYYRKLENFERSVYVKKEEKQKGWKDYLLSYQQENPYSEEDNRLRREAERKASYWEDEIRREQREIAQKEREKEEAIREVKRYYESRDYANCKRAIERAKRYEKNNAYIKWVEEKLREIPQELTYGLPQEIWSSCKYKHNGEWLLDMASQRWCSLSVSEQQRYAKAYQEGYARAKGYDIEKTFSGIVMRLIPPGRFYMGSSETEVDSYSNEKPRHRVIISKAFYVGKYEVTQGQWQSVMGSNPSYFKAVGSGAPVDTVSWNDCQGFLQKSSLRFLTEAEWEYACRAGTTTPFNLGANITPDQVNYDGNYPYAGGSKGIYREKTVVCGSLPNANAWGCYDFHGNIWEWVQDRYSSSIYSNRDNIADPLHNTTGAGCVLRGGRWGSDGRRCRSSDRSGRSPSDADGWRGVRAARSLP